MKIAYLGAGAWGFSLASLLAAKKYKVIVWTSNPDLAEKLNSTREHPLFPGHRTTGDIHFTTDLEKVIHNPDILVESLTSAGLRSILYKIKEIKTPQCPIVITSKGIEQNTGLILPDVAVQVFGENIRPHVGFLSGPSFAQEVVKGLPTSVVAAAYDPQVTLTISNVFCTPTFRVYPNNDIRGVSFGGALKNPIAIACGIAEGLSLGLSARAALMTRGLHEIKKLAVNQGCLAETINGLSGMGDLCLTCNSTMSRNFRFGIMLAQGISPREALAKIGMVVEGAYSCVSAVQLSKQNHLEMPITEGVFNIIYEQLHPKQAVKSLMERTIKEEHL